MLNSSLIAFNRRQLQHLFDNNAELNEIREKFMAAMGIKNPGTEKPIIASGHQPTLYHPGILFKNFFAGKSAEEAGVTAINFVVDSDNANFSVPVPYKEDGEYHKTYITLKNSNSNTFAGFTASKDKVTTFLESVEKCVNTLPEKEIWQRFQEFKDDFLKKYEAGYHITDIAISDTNKHEELLNTHTKNIKISGIANSEAFYHYVWYIFKHISRFSEVYNNAVAESKSKNYQPVKFLDITDSWYELPFWLIRKSKRYPALIKKEENTIHIYSEKGKTNISIDTRNKDKQDIIGEIRDSVTLYPKAVTLSLMLRCFLTDIFIHGTGAIEYEQINTRIIREFFGMEEAPAFYSVTGDVYLPFLGSSMHYETLSRDYNDKAEWLRGIDRDPISYLNDEQAERYKEEKKKRAARLKTEEDSNKRVAIHKQLERIDEAAKRHFQQQINEVKEQLRHYDSLFQKSDVFFERTYPCFLHPEDNISEDIFTKKIWTQEIHR